MANGMICYMLKLEEIEKLAKLARLEIPAEEKETLRKEVGRNFGIYWADSETFAPRTAQRGRYYS